MGILDTVSALVYCSIVIPFIFGMIIIVSPRRAAKALTVIAGALSSACTLTVWICYGVSGAEAITIDLASIGDCAILTFIVDKMSTMFSFTFVFVGMLIAIYAIGYMSPLNREHPDGPSRRFFAIFTIFIGAMPGFVYADTTICQLFFYEVSGVCSWGLIGYFETPLSRDSAHKELILTHLAALGLYIGSAFLFFLTGTFSVSAIGGLSEGWKTVILLLVVWAAWGKSAQLPLYAWLPSAMNSPTPCSAYLHGASMVKIGVTLCARELISAGPIPEAVGWVLVVGAICTMIFCFFSYLPQTDLKRLLAFSTISQLSYIFLGFGFFCFNSDLAFDGSLMHIFNHAFAKSLFFLIAGVFMVTMGTKLMTKITGLIKKQPLIAVGLVAAAFAIAGVPPFSGFFSKFAIFAGGFEAATHNWILLVIVIVGLLETVGTFAWFLRWTSTMVPGEMSETVADATPVPISMKIPIVVLIIMTLISAEIAGWWLA